MCALNLKRKKCALNQKLSLNSWRQKVTKQHGLMPDMGMRWHRLFQYSCVSALSKKYSEHLSQDSEYQATLEVKWELRQMRAALPRLEWKWLTWFFLEEIYTHPADYLQRFVPLHLGDYVYVAWDKRVPIYIGMTRRGPERLKDGYHSLRSYAAASNRAHLIHVHFLGADGEMSAGFVEYHLTQALSPILTGKTGRWAFEEWQGLVVGNGR